MTEKLTEYERGWLSYRLPVALRIIDEQAAALVVEYEVSAAHYERAESLEAQLAEARAQSTQWASRTDRLQDQLAEARAADEVWRGALAAEQRRFAEARALLDSVRGDYRYGAEIEAFLAANPESPREDPSDACRYGGSTVLLPVSPRADVYHMVGCDARDDLPCTHDCQQHRYGVSPRAERREDCWGTPLPPLSVEPRAAAERAVLKAPGVPRATFKVGLDGLARAQSCPEHPSVESPRAAAERAVLDNCPRCGGDAFECRGGVVGALCSRPDAPVLALRVVKS